MFRSNISGRRKGGSPDFQEEGVGVEPLAFFGFESLLAGRREAVILALAPGFRIAPGCGDQPFGFQAVQDGIQGAGRPAYLAVREAVDVLDDLVAAVHAGEIAGAGLDVYEREPAMAEGLANLENAILLPHLGSATRGTRNLMATKAATNALAMLKGERAPNCLNPEVYDGEAYRKRSA
ncbi:MAG: hypothetical protein IH827_09055 [Myxococcales bacterium]|nr:hypothetical protein [Myxococcales bacterium]